MKKLKKLLICLMLCVFGFGLIACGDDRTEQEKNFTYPTEADAVYGNGGLAVRKGNYVYFVNGYKSVTTNDLTKDTTFNVGSLMLAKLGADGQLVTNETGSIRDDYFITMSNKLCGYEATDLFIHGNYLYFVSPCLENETGDEVWAKERVVFNRIKLDKTGDVEEVYSSGVKYNNLEYKYYQTNGGLYILAWEKGETKYAENPANSLIRINTTNSAVEVVDSGVTNVIFSENANNVFFTKKDDKNYELKKYNVSSNSVNVYHSSEKSFELKMVTDENVFITKTHDTMSSYTDLMISNFMANDKSFKLFHSNVADYTLDATDDGSAVIAIKGNVMNIINVNQNFGASGTTITKSITVNTDATSIKIIGYTNGCVLFYDTASSNSNISLVSYSNAIAGSDVEVTTLTTISAVADEYAYFDLSNDENLLYFYKMSGNDYYLHKIKVNNNIEEKEQMIGVYDEEDIPEIEEEETEEEEEE